MVVAALYLQCIPTTTNTTRPRTCVCMAQHHHRYIPAEEGDGRIPRGGTIADGVASTIIIVDSGPSENDGLNVLTNA